MRIILFFAIGAFCTYILGYYIGKWVTAKQVEEMRKQLDLEENMDEWYKFFYGGGDNE